VIVYIHGFNSSPASFKARLVQQHLAVLGRAKDFRAPELPHSSLAASRLLSDLVKRHPHAALIGSSLGGYYATWLAERYCSRAVLLNPAVRPYELLSGYVGRQKNLHTGDEYNFTAQHIEEMRALEVDAITPQRYLLMVETGDDVLDYRQALERYSGAQQMVIDGGDHGFSDFSAHMGRALEFCGVTTG